MTEKTHYRDGAVVLYKRGRSIKCRANGHVINKAVYLAIGVTMDGIKRGSGDVGCRNRRCQVLVTGRD